jgi:hypothetical protein
MKKMFDQAVEAARANPVRFAGWMVLLAVLCVAAIVLADGFGAQLELFTH